MLSRDDIHKLPKSAAWISQRDYYVPTGHECNTIIVQTAVSFLYLDDIFEVTETKTSIYLMIAPVPRFYTAPESGLFLENVGSLARRLKILNI